MGKNYSQKAKKRILASALAASMLASMLPLNALMASAASSPLPVSSYINVLADTAAVEVPAATLHYDFASDASDVSGNSNNGTVDGSVTIADGIGDFSGGKITFPVAALKSAKTISMMVKMDAGFDTWWPTILEAGPEGGTPFVKIAPYSQEANNRRGISITRGNGTDEVRTMTSSSLPTDQWTELTFVLDGDNVIVYMNGAAVATTTFFKDQQPDGTAVFGSDAFSSLADTATASLGGPCVWPDRAFDGQIADFRLFDTALSAEQVAAVYYENRMEIDPDAVSQEVEIVNQMIAAALDVSASATLTDLNQKISDAKDAYGQLSVENQALVTGYDELQALETTIGNLDEVDAQLAELPAGDTIEDLEDAEAALPTLQSAEKAVASLGAVSKYLENLDQYNSLRNAVYTYIKSSEALAVEEMIDAIGTLPTENAYKLAPVIWAAQKAYDALSANDQNMVDSAKKATLDAAVAAMEALKDSFSTDLIGGEGNWSGGAFAQSPWMAYNNFTAEERSAILATMQDEIVYQYMHEGYDLGFLTATPKGVQEQEGLLYAEIGDGGNGGDNIPGCNPWAQADRRWAAVVAPYEGVAFSIKSPFGYLGVANLLLLGNAFEYDGTVYLLTKTGVHSYDASLQTVASGDIDTDATLFPGADDTGADVTNGTFAYAAALYNQAEKWNSKTVGIPSGNVVLTADGDTYYQAFEGPDGVAYIVGDAAAVEAADANVPVEAAYVLDADDLAALLAATSASDAVSALAQTGAPYAARPESGRWEFAKGYIENGSFTAYTPAQLVEREISAIPAIPEGGIADEATYDTIKAAYDSALAAYNELEEGEQADVENEDVLTACGEALAVFEDQLATAEEMRDTLYALPYTVDSIVEDTETDWAEAIAAARTAYDALDDIEKALVTDTYYGYLEDAEAALEAAEVVTEYYQKVPEDYQEAWGALYEDEESYLAGEEYATYVAPLATAVENLSADGYDVLLDSDYWTAIDEVLTWTPAEPGPGPDEPYTIEDVMAACRVVARNNAGGEPTSDELARYDMNDDGAVLIDDIMAICRELASYNLQQQ